MLNVPLFASIKSVYREQMLIDLWLMMKSKTFAASRVNPRPQTLDPEPLNLEL